MMGENTPEIRHKAERGARVVQGMPEPLEITIATDPQQLIFYKGQYLIIDGMKATYRQWCEREVERIGKIPGHSPRIAMHRDRKGKLSGKILVVDDEFTLPEHNSHTDGVVIQRFHETRSQWETTS